MPFVMIDGVNLYFEEAGAGDPPMLLVHGWACNLTHLEHQAMHFASTHRVVSVDLRGHGRSGTRSGEYTMASFADDVADLCRAVALDRPVVVGHSMGGAIALELAARHPEAVRAAVMLDSAVLWPEALTAPLADFIAALRTPAFLQAQQDFVATMCFTPDDDVRVKERVLAEMSTCPQEVMVSSFEQLFAWDAAAAAVGAKVPVLFIAAHVVAPDMVRFKELCPQLVTGQTVGAGHFNQLLVPDQVNSMVDRFVRLVVADPTALDRELAEPATGPRIIPVRSK
jgi:pimeloyl-ACP methyl ester carboxylesterase